MQSARISATEIRWGQEFVAVADVVLNRIPYDATVLTAFLRNVECAVIEPERFVECERRDIHVIHVITAVPKIVH